jgi:hypothetical protein
VNKVPAPAQHPAQSTIGPFGTGVVPDLLRSLSISLSAQYLQYKREEGIDLTIEEVPSVQRERIESIYSPEPIGMSPQGHPVFLYQERILAEPRFVVQLPNGKAVFSDRQGRINPISNGDQVVTAAILAGFGGIVLAGTVGGLTGAVAGAAITRMWLKRRSNSDGPLSQ